MSFQGENMYYVFINPASGSNTGSTVWEEAKKILDEKQIPYTAYFTEKEKPITDIYEQIYSSTAERPIKLIVIGGDGTLDQVVDGITHISETELSLIRNGSGNDFTRDKSLPTDVGAALNGILSRAHESMTDIGNVTYTCGTGPSGAPIPDGTHNFLVSAGFGYDADICYSANHSPRLKKILKSQIYTYYGVKDLFTTGLADMEITIDDKILLYPHVYFAAVMNEPFEGGGVPMAPDAVDTDGVLNCIVIYGLSRFEALMLVPKLKSAKHLGHRGVSLINGKKIHISSSIPKMVHYDGETPGLYKEFDAKIIGQIKLVY